MFSVSILMMVCWTLGQVPLPEVRVDIPPPGKLQSIGDIRIDSASEQIEEIFDGELKQLAEIVAKSNDSAEIEAAKQLQNILKKTEAKPGLNGMQFELLPDVVPIKGNHLAEYWNQSAKLKSLRKTSVERLWKVAGKAAFQERYRITDQSLRAIVRRDPDQAEAWRVLGYVPFKDSWATPYAMAQLERGHIKHPRFGWMEKSWIEPLENGQLPIGVDLQNRKKVVWGPAEMANAAHSDWANAWEIVTEHFRIRSNVSFEEAVAFSQKLEAFYQFFFSLMADLIGPQLPLAKRWRIKGMRPEVSPVEHHVYYFADKDQYVTTLTPLEGESIAESIGYYRRPPQGASSRQRGGKGISYFFQDRDGQLPVEATLYHEASHQFLFETAGRDKMDSNRGHYWLFEGLGTCFETVEVVDNKAIVFGAPKGPRMDVARNRILSQGGITPYELFEAYGQTGFNLQSRVHDHYAQAMALTLYFLFGSDARTRDLFMDYSRDAYKGRLRGSRGMANRLGVSPQVIDEAFISYLKKTAVEK